MKTILILIVLIVSLSSYGQDKIFSGYKMNEFSFKGHEAKIVVPHERNMNGNWIWRARFWGHEPQVDKALLDKGFHVAYIDVADLFVNTESLNVKIVYHHSESIYVNLQDGTYK